MEINLEDFFEEIRQAYEKQALDIKHFETDYVTRFSFTISKYRLNLNEENSPEAN